MEVGPLRPGAEGPPPLPASLRRSQGVPTSLGSLALSLSRLGYHVAPHSTLGSIQSHEHAGSGLVKSLGLLGRL